MERGKSTGQQHVCWTTSNTVSILFNHLFPTCCVPCGILPLGCFMLSACPNRATSTNMSNNGIYACLGLNGRSWAWKVLKYINFWSWHNDPNSFVKSQVSWNTIASTLDSCIQRLQVRQYCWTNAHSSIPKIYFYIFATIIDENVETLTNTAIIDKHPLHNVM